MAFSKMVGPETTVLLHLEVLRTEQMRRAFEGEKCRF